MNEVEKYKIVWNTKANQGVFLLNKPNGIEQILVDSPQEASLLLKQLRHSNSKMHHQDKIMYEGFVLDDAENRATPAPKETAKIATTEPVKNKLQLIEGIGPKIEGLLNEAGIYSFLEVKSAKTSTLKTILADAGARFRMHDPSTWGQQAALAANGDWEALKELQQALKGGKKAS